MTRSPVDAPYSPAASVPSKTAPRYPGAETIAVFVLSLAFLLWMSDWTGLDGDDLNSVLPTLHLPSALDGGLLVYRYGWQALSYWISYAAYGLTGKPEAIFALVPLCTAGGFAMLYRAVRHHVGLAPVLFVPLLLLFPELFYNGFYYNATALGFPFAGLAVLLTWEAPGRAGAALCGVSLALAVLIRLDFILMAPAIALFRFWHVRLFGDFLVVVVAGLAALAAGWLLGLLPLREIVEIYGFARDEIIAKANDGGWNARAKLFVTTTVFSPLGWLLLPAAGLFVLRRRQYWLPVGLGLLAMAPMLLSARNMLTPKYMIPAFALFPVMAAIAWMRITEEMTKTRVRLLTGGWIAATLFLLVFSVEPRPRPPYLIVTATEPFQINTHDGRRSWGAYLRQMAIATHQSFPEENAKADAVFMRLMQPGSQDIVIVGGQNVFTPGGFAWRQLQLRLERAGYHGRLSAPNVLSFDVPAGRLTLLDAATELPPGACRLLLDSDAAAFQAPAIWIDTHCRS